MRSPTLVVVSGAPGTGKTTLAHLLADALGCPAVCRDEIKEGMVHALPDYRPEPGDATTARATRTFFEMLGLLVDAGVTTVAEAAFQDRLWRPTLGPLAERASLRVVRCTVDPALARQRLVARLARDARRAAHDDRAAVGAATGGSSGGLVPAPLPFPSLTVDTTDGYAPELPAILAFVRTPRP